MVRNAQLWQSGEGASTASASTRSSGQSVIDEGCRDEQSTDDSYPVNGERRNYMADEQLNHGIEELRTAIGEVEQMLTALRPRVHRLNAALAAVTAGITDREELARRIEAIAALLPVSDAVLFLTALMMGSGPPEK